MRCWLLGLVMGSLALAGLGSAQAQFHRATDPVWTPPHVLVQRDDAMAIDVNPAALALARSWSLAYLHAESRDTGWPMGGDAFFAAAPLALGLATGVTIQDVRPEPGSLGIDHRRASFALACARSRGFGFGATLHRIGSPNARLDGLTSLDLGMTWQPSALLAVSLTGRDLLLSRGGAGYRLDIGPSAVLATTLRPLGHYDLALDVALGFDTQQRLGARVSSYLPLPWLGAASLSAEVEDIGSSRTTVRALAGLTLSWGATSVGAALTGDVEGQLGGLAFARLEGAVRPGLPMPKSALNLELTGGMDARRILRVALALEQALRDERVGGVLLRLRGTDLGLAYAQELRLQIASLRKAGKRVVCHLEMATGSEYYACAGADQILLDPAGGIRLMGTSARVLLLGESLRRAGIRADFVRIGKYKSAPEQLMHSSLSAPAREQTNAFLDDVFDRLVVELARDRGREQTDDLRRLIDRGPLLATQALKAKMASGTADEFELEKLAKAAFGGLPLKSALPQKHTRQRGLERRVGVVVVDHNIADGENTDVPFVGIHTSGGRTVAKAIETLAKNPNVGAIVLRVDSPGGTMTAADQIWRAVRRARKHKPVIASMGSLAASGGYHVASAADEIWANPATLTGSIGVFYGKIDVAGLAENLHIGIEHMQRGRHAGALSLYRPFTPDERATLAELTRSWYRSFLERVAAGRNMDPSAVDALGQGRVWSGDAALSNGLVDKLGGFASALMRARQLAGLAPDAPVTVVPQRKSRLRDYVLGGMGQARTGPAEASPAASEHGSPALPHALGLAPFQQALETALTLGQASGQRALALMPYVISLEF